MTHRALLVAILVLLVQWMGQRVTQQSASQKEFIPPAKATVHFTFGFSELAADLLWLRLIQNLDDCSRLFSDDQKGVFSGKDELDQTSGRVRCKRSWTFRMLDAITDLSPRFRMAAATGGINLSVLLDDYEGAQIIFDKAIRNFPTDWSILYRASYHYLFDLNNRERAAELMLAAADNGAPAWLRFSAAKLMSEEGKVDFGLKVLYDYLRTLKDDDERKIVIEKIEKIKAQVGCSQSDISCSN